MASPDDRVCMTLHRSWMRIFGPSRAKPKPLSPGTEGSNPAPSTSESGANLTFRGHRSDGHVALLAPTLGADRLAMVEREMQMGHWRLKQGFVWTLRAS